MKGGLALRPESIELVRERDEPIAPVWFELYEPRAEAERITADEEPSERALRVTIPPAQPEGYSDG
jgi:hypothetical protein